MAAEEPHYRTLCAVSKRDDSAWQAFSKRTLHKLQLRIIAQMCCSTFALPGAGYRCSRRGGFSDNSVRRQGRPGAPKVRRARVPFFFAEGTVGTIVRRWEVKGSALAAQAGL
jgi:hypothetical protein